MLDALSKLAKKILILNRVSEQDIITDFLDLVPKFYSGEKNKLMIHALNNGFLIQTHCSGLSGSFESIAYWFIYYKTFFQVPNSFTRR